jgi:hypothetical protein
MRWLRMPNFLEKVPVYNGDMTELFSTSPAKARILLEEQKAKVICTHPFTVRLNCVKKLTEKDILLLKKSRQRADKEK